MFSNPSPSKFQMENFNEGNNQIRFNNDVVNNFDKNINQNHFNNLSFSCQPQNVFPIQNFIPMNNKLFDFNYQNNNFNYFYPVINHSNQNNNYYLERKHFLYDNNLNNLINEDKKNTVLINEVNNNYFKSNIGNLNSENTILSKNMILNK